MVNVKNEEIFKKTYKLLNQCTPLPVDCGQLCDGACCKGDEDTGMLLFPGEEEFFVNDKDFEIRETDYVLDDGYVVKLLLCNSKCERARRPLACRIFPLIGFYVEDKNVDMKDDQKIEVKIDPRAYESCPLAIVGIEEGVSKEFLLKVKKVFEILMEDKRCADFIKIMTEQLNFGG